MADRSRTYAENVPGPFFVDDRCVYCDMCRTTAPRNFARGDHSEYAYVAKQPEDAEEWASCQEAMQDCPAGAVGQEPAPTEPSEGPKASFWF